MAGRFFRLGGNTRATALRKDEDCCCRLNYYACYYAGLLLLLVSRMTANIVLVLLLVQTGLLRLIIIFWWRDILGFASCFSCAPYQAEVQHAPVLQQMPPRGVAPAVRLPQRVSPTHLLVAAGA